MNTYTVATIAGAKEANVIYCLTFKNGKQYIGQAKSLTHRIAAHIGNLICGIHNRLMQESFTTPQEITIDVVEQCTKESLDEAERRWIDTIPTELSLNLIHSKANGFTQEQRKRMSDIKKGRALSQEHKDAIANAQRGKKRIQHRRGESEEDYTKRIEMFIAQHPDYQRRTKYVAKTDRSTP